MNTIDKRPNVWNLFGIALILAFAAISAAGLFADNDFWIDEAMLIQSVFTRTFTGIVSAPPDYSQSSPLGYLFLLKIFSLVLGNTEFAVRLPAVLANFGLMFFAYRIAKDLIRSKSPLFYAGTAVLCIVLVDYGTQAKQYPFEAMCFLLCVWVLGLYWRGGGGG
jgi:4-amino-4-deoxy-L-arabinose transferase-like glycosyltransferase